MSLPPVPVRRVAGPGGEPAATTAEFRTSAPVRAVGVPGRWR
ncbi:hypothetical protein [Streptomyces sp. AN091965]|nr:hypothetical protein [Streptomyces sp. AN091965]